ncbi:intradiol ring-cleavage dioxygenase [Xanthovirga aplysinae]|uniref:dioxygenase family protein n=1 Tax=Xanthovirga aplysinae TaxID=2529853 RepID=UPI0012BB9B1F|nr:intradiol ring-cleavage dioxygenase [Xanthovirga aplysinae]MTI32368.1 intradiol ring-cleavage dioxygenase [Xanthovirga aplysinae]
MKRLIILGLFAVLFNILTACNAQNSPNNQTGQKVVNKNKIVGGGCEVCQLMYVGMPTNIKSVDYSLGWKEEGQKLLVTGTVYRLDGKTPAPNIVIYYWHADPNGNYSPREGMEEKARPHGYLRGWVKSDKNGKYSIYTLKPGHYSTDDTPAHIHLSVKEPHLDNEYYIDDLVFDDDKRLTARERRAFKNRGGSGILKVSSYKDMQIAQHDIILGLNILNYPGTLNKD